MIKEFIRNDLTAFQRLYLKDRDIKNVILMGDFLTDTIFREELGDHIITSDEFTKRYEKTIYKTEQALAQEMDIDPEYASLVIPTMVICKNFLEIFQAESVWVPGVSLLDGIAYDYGEKKKFIKSVHNFENDILVASKNIAKRYSTGKDHIKGTTDIALTIFDSMKKVHGMGARERLLLQIAVQLHDCGKYISMADVAECSYRIIMATEIIGLSTEERKVIASAVRYNTTEFVYYGNYDEGPEIDRERYLLVAKLTAILRLANAMDRSHYQKVESLRVVLKDRELQMIIDSSRDISLELGLLRDKVKFFEEVFGIRLVLNGNAERKRRRINMDLSRYEKPEYYVNRELSWLKFDERVLSEARDKSLPLFERLKFLSITSSNLDEFFMVRVASLKDQVHAGYKKKDIAGMSSEEQLKEISSQTHELVRVQYSTFNRSVLPALEKVGLHLVAEHEDLTVKQAEFVDRYFEDNVYPVLTPMAMDSSRPFPLIRNRH